ncbi:protein of unknown function DUF23 domain-containing protein [Aphelenchoides fujianensis]|nr:protein of unknown function DUF23 domain-containing protein [Aphelenchoides fujianensis]
MSSKLRWKYAGWSLLLLSLVFLFALLSFRLIRGRRTFESDRMAAEEVYVFTGYRVSDDEIRVALIRNDHSDVPIVYSLEFAEGGERTASRRLRVECQRAGECPAAFSPPCSLSGYVGTIREPLMHGRNVSFVHLSTPQRSFRLAVRDVRNPPNSSKRPHRLGVCVQPIFVHADWPQFVQFFEYWLDAGATKFFVYRESYSGEVQRIIDFYRANGRAQIELIDWSKLPQRESWSRSHFDPNDHWYRLEAGDVRFVAQSDLDELFFVNSAPNLLEFLEWTAARNPRMASLNFLSRRVRVPNYWDRIAHPSDFNFAALREVEFEREVFARDLYSKNIYIPERVKRFDIHVRREAEAVPGRPNETFVHLNVSVHDGLVLHFRRVDSDVFLWQESAYTTELEAMSQRLERNFLRRLQADRKGLMDTRPWPNVGAQMLALMEKCRNEQYERKMERCYSLQPCDWEVRRAFAGRLDWFVARNTWAVI